MEDDLSDLEYAPTRSSLLRERGYSEEIIAGNAHVVALAESPVTRPEPAPGESVMGGERVCRGCGASLEARKASAVWCSDKCRRKAAEARRPTRRQNAKDLGGSGWPAEGQIAVTERDFGTATEVQAGNGVAGFDRLVEVVRALADAGLTVTVTLDGLELSIRA